MRIARRSAVTPETLRPGETQLLLLITANPGHVRAWYAAEYGVSQNTMSCYLDVLKAAGLIHASGRGRFAVWRVGRKPVPEVRMVNSVFALA